MLYIPVDPVSVENYLKWYLSAHIGNLLTIRPSYRWNGTRTLNSAVYRKLAGFLDAMGIRYSHMLDGRELPGCNCNPSVEELDSGSFLGRQTHEFDGQFAYWGYRDVICLRGHVFLKEMTWDSERIIAILEGDQDTDVEVKFPDGYIPEIAVVRLKDNKAICLQAECGQRT